MLIWVEAESADVKQTNREHTGIPYHTIIRPQATVTRKQFNPDVCVMHICAHATTKNRNQHASARKLMQKHDSAETIHPMNVQRGLKKLILILLRIRRKLWTGTHLRHQPPSCLEWDTSETLKPSSPPWSEHWSKDQPRKTLVGLRLFIERSLSLR